MTPPRHQSQTQRDLDGIAAKKQRESRSAHAIPDDDDSDDSDSDGVPEDFDLPATGVVQGPELWKRRRGRKTQQRLDHADERIDKLVGELVKSREFVRALAWKVMAIVGPIITYLIGKYT